MQISLPNFNDNTNIDTAKLIEDLLEVERQPIIRIEDRIQTSQETITIWDNIEQDMRLFQNNAKKLYSFNNPFGERVVASSDETIVVAQAQRNSTMGQYEIIVKQVATSDKWISGVIPDNYKMPTGTYTFMVGSEDISFDMNGGNVNQFVELVNTRGKDFMKASIIQKGVGTEEKVLLLEALVSGEKGKLQLVGAASAFGNDIGLLRTNTGDITPIELKKDAVDTFYSEENLFSDTTTEGLESDAVRMVLLPGAFGKFKIPVSSYRDVLSNKDATILFDLQVERTQPTTGSVVVPPITAQLEDVVVEGESTSVLDPLEERDGATTGENDNAPTTYPMLLDKNLSVQFAIEKDALSSGAHIPISIPAQSVVVDDTVEYTLVNPFAEYQFIVTSMQFSEKADTSELVPASPISEARNAIVEFKGVDIERETNNIEDIIPGVTLVLKRARADKNISISITSNEALIKDDIIAFIGSYNNLIRSLTIYTFSDLRKLRTIIEFQSPQELEVATRDMGKLSGEFSLIRLITNLQNILTKEYINRTATQLSSLRNMGIASNLTSTSAVSSSRFLDIDEQLLDDTIINNPQGVAMLFGSDTNNDVAIDYGVAYSSSEAMNNYLFANGIISQKQSSLNTTIGRDTKDLERANTRLERYEAEVRRKFGNMEQIVQELNKSSDALKNLPLLNNSKK